MSRGILMKVCEIMATGDFMIGIMSFQNKDATNGNLILFASF